MATITPLQSGIFVGCVYFAGVLTLPTLHALERFRRWMLAKAEEV